MLFPYLSEESLVPLYFRKNIQLGESVSLNRGQREIYVIDWCPIQGGTPAQHSENPAFACVHCSVLSQMLIIADTALFLLSWWFEASTCRSCGFRQVTLSLSDIDRPSTLCQYFEWIVYPHCLWLRARQSFKDGQKRTLSQVAQGRVIDTIGCYWVIWSPEWAAFPKMELTGMYVDVGDAGLDSQFLGSCHVCSHPI